MTEVSYLDNLILILLYQLNTGTPGVIILLIIYGILNISHLEAEILVKSTACSLPEAVLGCI